MNAQAIATLIIITLANWATGTAVLRNRAWQRSDWIENQFIAILIGICINGWFATILAELHFFHTLPLLILWLTPILILLWLPLTQNRQTSPSPHTKTSAPSVPLRSKLLHPSSLLLLLWLPLAAAIFLRPHEWVRGGLDPGSYINITASIAQTGGLLVDDPVLANLDPSILPGFVRAIPDHPSPYYLAPGFFVDGSAPGRITPQFYPLHPAWQAVAYKLGGVWSALTLTGLWAILSTLTLYFIGRTLSNWRVGITATLALTLCALQAWFGRYPTAELLTQLFIWTGIYATINWLTPQKPPPPLRLCGKKISSHPSDNLWPFLTALTFGSALLTRIDSFFFAALPLTLLLWHLLTTNSTLLNSPPSAPLRSILPKLTRPQTLYFLIPFTILALHTLIHGLTQTRPYFLKTFGWMGTLLSREWQFPLAVTLVGIALLFIIIRYQRTTARLWPAAKTVTIALLLGISLWAWFIRAAGQPGSYPDGLDGALIYVYDYENLVRLGWYLSPVAVWLGILGACLLIWHIKPNTTILLTIGITFSLLFLWKLNNNHKQIYGMRRYVPVTVPFFMLSAAYLINWLSNVMTRLPLLSSLSPLRASAVKNLTQLTLTLTLLIPIALHARGFVSQVDDAGVYNQIATISDRLEPDSIVLFNDPNPYHHGESIGITLRFIFGHTVFAVHDWESLDQTLLNAQLDEWRNNGRAIHWITYEPEPTSPLTGWQLTNTRPYALTFSFLQHTYTEKPTLIHGEHLTGNISTLTRP